jgi:carboxylesterase
MDGTNGSTIVLIHGMTGTPNEMRFIANFLNKKGYGIVCPRLAYHGESIKTLKNAKWQDFYSTVRGVMEDGSVMKGSGPVYASGLSMGALLALLLADEFSGKIRGVSCLAPTLFYDGWNSPDVKFFLPLGDHTILKHFFYFKEDPPYGIKNEAMQARIHRYYKDAKLDDMGDVAQYGYPFFPVTLLCQLKRLVNHLSNRLPHMKFPVQLIQAKEDDMASVKNSKFIYDRIGSEMKEMVLLYDSYHVITADQERKTVAEKMSEFFGKIG